MNDFSGKRVVFIDDDKINLKIVERKLKAYNITINLGTSMAELFQLLKVNYYDLVILDDMMTVMTGIEAMEILKGKTSNGIYKGEIYTKPIVVLTGNAEDIGGQSARDRYLELGFDEFIPKPVNDEEIHRVLNRFLN